MPKLNESKANRGGGTARKKGVRKVHDARSEVHGRGETYTTMDELKAVTLAACRREMLKIKLRSGSSRSQTEHELELQVEDAKRILGGIGRLNRTSDALIKIREGLLELAQLEDLDKPPESHSNRLAAQINRSVGPTLLAMLSDGPLFTFVGEQTAMLHFAYAYERMGWTDFRAIACMAILAGYWPNLAGRELLDLPVAEVIQTVREAVKFQQPKVRLMRQADAQYVPPKFRIVGTK